jgi:hypothetical protein
MKFADPPATPNVKRKSQLNGGLIAIREGNQIGRLMLSKHRRNQVQQPQRSVAD